jgi:hypothetical protein
VVANAEFKMDWTALDDVRGRISWPSVVGKTYRVLTADRSGQTTVLTNIPGKFPETELVIDPNVGVKLFRIEERD